jgi:hypothetical protein
MIKFLTALAAVAATFCVSAEVWQAEYGVSRSFDFKLYNADGTLDTDEVDSGTEVTVDCNGTPATATNDYADEGSFYSIVLTAAELQCERTTVTIAATTTEVFFIQTFGGASAFNETVGWTAAARTLTALDEDSTTLDLDATSIIAGSITSGAIQAADFAAGAIDASAIAADAIGASELATDAIGAAEIAADAIAASEVAAGAIAEDAFATTAGSFDALGIVDQGTMQSGSIATTAVLRAAASFADDTLNGSTLLIVGGTGVGQSRKVTDWTSASDTATVETWTTTPDNTSVYQVYGTPNSAATDVNVLTITDGAIAAADFATGAITATVIAADAIGASELATDAIGAAEIASAAIAADEIATDAIGAAELASAAIAADEIAADAIGASEIAADAIAASELATAAVNEVRDLVIEDQGGGVTLGCAIAIVMAYAAGDLATTGADSTYEDPSGTETRATGTVASAGNRTAAITCPTY